MTQLGQKVINKRYEVLEEIGQGGLSRVYLAHDLREKRKVAVKVLKERVTSSRGEDLIRFRNETNAISRLSVPGIVEVYEINEIEDMRYMVMEYVEGESLQQLLEKEKYLEPDKAVEIVYQVAWMLQQVHQEGVFHRDIKPANLLIKRNYGYRDSSMEVKLIDFGLARLKEFSWQDADTIAGTLYYMPPEQSGAVKKNVDERSDLYSLGVILYQMLTGEVPFYGDNLITIIHQHIAMAPEPPSHTNPEVPSVLDRIVIKLLEKEPGKRYQGAASLLKDLEKYRLGEVDFLPGTGEKVWSINTRAPLVNRETELFQLKQSFFRSSRGEGGICVVKGEAGVGKSRLIEEFRDFVLENQGVYIEGRCFSGKEREPYAPFKEALNDFISYFSKYPLDRQQEVKMEIQKAVGDLGRVMTRFSPAAQQFFEEMPPLVELESDRESKRFHMVVSDFFFALGCRNNPLVMVLENLQWSDDDSFELLREMSFRINERPVLLVLVSRKEEEIIKDRMQVLLEESRKSKVLFAELELLPFNEEEMKDYLARLMGEQVESIEELSYYIMERTGGNPLFGMELLKQLLEKGLVEKQHGRWILGQGDLKQFEIKSGLVDILLEQISLLNREEVDLLSVASVIGKEFDIKFLAALTGLEEEKVIEIIDEAVRKQILNYHDTAKGKTVFKHERLKETFYEKLSGARKRELHLDIAGLLEERYREQLDEVYFDLAHHFSEAGEKEKAIEYCCLAGIKAKDSYASKEALSYLQKAAGFMEQLDYTRAEKWVEIMENKGDVYLDMGENDSAREVFENILRHTDDREVLLRGYQKISRALLNKGDWISCQNYVRQGLKLLGEKLPENNFQKTLGLLREALIRGWHTVFAVYYDRKKESKDASLYKEIFPFFYCMAWVYTLSDGLMHLHSVLRFINLAESKMGPSKEKALGLGAYASVFMGLGFFSVAEKYYKKGMKLKARLNDTWGIARYYQWMGYLCEWKGDYDKGLEYFQESLEMFQSIGDIKETRMSLNGIVHCYYYTGNYERMKNVNDYYLELSTRCGDTYCRGAASVYNIHYYRETGNLKASQEWGEEAVEFAASVEHWFNYCSANNELAITLLEKGEVDKSIKHFEIARELKENNFFLEQYTILLYPYLADAYISRYHAINSKLSHKEKGRELKNIRKVVAKALKGTKGWPTHHGVSLRVAAREAFALGKNKKADKLYRNSLEHNRKHKRRYEAARTLYEYGQFLRYTGRYGEAHHKIEEAYRMFKKLGARLYESRAAATLGLENYIISTEERFTRDLGYAQRLLSIIELSREISSLLELEELLEKITSVAIEVAGAQKGYLVLKNERTGKMEVRAGKGLERDYGGEDVVSGRIVQEVVECEEPVLTANALEDEKYSRCETVVNHELKSVMCVPIKYQNEVKGACYLVNNLSTDVFTEEDLGVLEVIMGQAAISIENAKLYEQAITDDLTGLFTLKHFKLLLQNEIERAFRNQQALSVIMMDIDYFRDFNNTYGHQLGDLVLMKVAEIARAQSRNIDVLARYGGEEFIIYLPETDPEGAMVYAERLRQTIEKTNMEYENKNLNITVSMGIVSYPEHARDIDSLINFADRSMYQSKKKGRNQVSIYGEEI